VRKIIDGLDGEVLSRRYTSMTGAEDITNCDYSV
jgi:hypothetical protein